MALTGDTTTFSVWVPITAPFSNYPGPGEVKLVDGDLVYVKLRPGTFSRQDDLQNLSYQRLERKNMLRVKHLWPDKNDLILVLANLRTPSAWVSSNNVLGPCYGIVIIKDVFSGDVEDIKAKLESGYIDHKADNVVFIPCPVPFSKLSVMDKAIVVASKATDKDDDDERSDKLVIYDRVTGADITPEILQDSPKREGKKTNQQVDFSVSTGNSFYVGRRVMETALCVMKPWSGQCRQRKDLDVHSGVVEWTLDRATTLAQGQMKVDNVMKKSCHVASNRINCRLVTSWDEKLAYPVLKLTCPESCVSNLHSTSEICLLDYCEVLARHQQVAASGGVIGGNAAPSEIVRLELKGLDSLSKRAEIKLVRKKGGLMGFVIEDNRREMLVVFDTNTCQLTNTLRLHEMFPGFHKFRMTEESVLIGTRQDLVPEKNPKDEDSGNMKRMTRQDTIANVEYTVYRVKLGVVDGQPEVVYRGPGVDFSVVYDREDFIIVQKNFDEISLVT